MRLKTLVAVLALAGLFAAPVRADVSTTGAGSAINAASTLPGQAGNRGCASVALSTRTPTLLLAARAGRISLEVINISSVNLGGDTARPPLLFISTGSTTNLGTAPVRSAFQTGNGNYLAPMLAGTGAAPILNGAKWTESGAIYSGAIYALAESSGTSGFDVLGRAQACEDY